MRGKQGFYVHCSSPVLPACLWELKSYLNYNIGRVKSKNVKCLGEKGFLALTVLIFSICLILVTKKHLERGCFYLKFNIHNTYIMYGVKAALDEWYLGRSPRGLSGAGFYPLFLKQTSIGEKTNGRKRFTFFIVIKNKKSTSLTFKKNLWQISLSQKGFWQTTGSVLLSENICPKYNSEIKGGLGWWW